MRVEQFLPYVDPFVVGESGVIDHHFFAENLLQTSGKLCGKRYFRHKEEHLVAAAEHIGDKVDVDFGFP